MEKAITEFRAKLSALIIQWRESGLPGRNQIENAAFELMQWKDSVGIAGIWTHKPPLMVTATLDDGFGNGLQTIHLLAAAVGMPTCFLGLLQSPRRVVQACRTFEAEWLGLTILHFDTDDAIREIVDGLGGTTRIIAGGPVFKMDSGFARQTGIDRVAADLTDFIQFCLDL